jgi:hypothetical protein
MQGDECWPPTGHVHEVVMASDASSVQPCYCAANTFIGTVPQVTEVSVASCVLCALCVCVMLRGD